MPLGRNVSIVFKNNLTYVFYFSSFTFASYDFPDVFQVVPTNLDDYNNNIAGLAARDKHSLLLFDKDQELPFTCQLKTKDLVLVVASGQNESDSDCPDTDFDFNFETEVTNWNDFGGDFYGRLVCYGLDRRITRAGCGLRSPTGGVLASQDPIICGGKFLGKDIKTEAYECYFLKDNRIVYLDNLRANSASIVLGDTLFIAGGYPKYTLD